MCLPYILPDLSLSLTGLFTTIEGWFLSDVRGSKSFVLLRIASSALNLLIGKEKA